MTRRALILVALAVRLRADAVQDVWSMLASVASALSEGNATQVLAAFDPHMPGYEQIRSDVTALVREVEVQSSIESLRNDGDDRRRTVELDWTLTFARRGDDADVRRRKGTLTVQVEQRGRKWRIVGLTPERFFAPPR